VDRANAQRTRSSTVETIAPAAQAQDRSITSLRSTHAPSSNPKPGTKPPGISSSPSMNVSARPWGSRILERTSAAQVEPVASSTIIPAMT
jgi:hypothetical protein